MCPELKVVKVGSKPPDDLYIRDNMWLDALAEQYVAANPDPSDKDALKKAKTEILLSADVICTTCASAGLADRREFSFWFLLLEEAGQINILAAMAALKYECWPWLGTQTNCLRA